MLHCNIIYLNSRLQGQFVIFYYFYFCEIVKLYLLKNVNFFSFKHCEILKYLNENVCKCFFIYNFMILYLINRRFYYYLSRFVYLQTINLYDFSIKKKKTKTETETGPNRNRTEATFGRQLHGFIQLLIFLLWILLLGQIINY